MVEHKHVFPVRSCCWHGAAVHFPFSVGQLGQTTFSRGSIQLCMRVGALATGPCARVWMLALVPLTEMVRTVNDFERCTEVLPWESVV